jgi:ABC-type sugar transport systems, permease components
MSASKTMSQKKLTTNRRITFVGILFLLPAIVVISFSTLFPFLFNIALSFVKWDGYKKIKWVFMDNYGKLLKASSHFSATLLHTAYLAVLTTVLSIVGGLILAVIIYKLGKKEGMFARLIVFMPSMMSFAIVALLFTFIFNDQLGPINNFLRSVGLSKYALAWLSERHLVIPIMASVSAWRGAGAIMILFYAALQMLPMSFLESSKLDGAGYVTQLRYIILPLLGPIIKLQTVLCLMGAFKSYDIVRVMTNGGPGMDSYTVPLLMLDTGFQYREFGLAAAMGCVLTLVILVAINILNKTFKGESYEY